MINKFNAWRHGLTPLQRLVVSFVLNWVYWLTAWLISEQLFFDERRSWRYHFFHAAWMAFFSIVPFNWKELKEVFTGRHRKVEDSN